MAAAKAVVDFSKLGSTFNLSKQALGGLAAFRKRNEDARKAISTLKEQKTEVDFNHYRSILKNSEVVDQMEKAYKSFKPVDYDLSQHLKAIDAFEAKAVESAEQTASKIEGELKQLNATLSDIENARPFEDLTLQDIAKARPEIPKTVDTMVSKGKWTVDGYKDKFGDLTAV